ncbi:hypothetical protein MED297_05149 [Reinekea sp. MED297]|uniref:Uncharacterized protein n=1 Tax=Reinekea blandensis MED297 TaxID=314283 RepID=A4BJ51_9GAMM|nr:hypothetical protein MED297_05149 [Reinekea sp. MED297] [Reinekea blandensis MED297]
MPEYRQRQRLFIIPTLREPNALLLQPVPFLFGLDTFGNDDQIQRLRQLHNGFQQLKINTLR